MFADVLTQIALFGSLFGICYVYFITRNRERMAMIEKGIGTELFNNPKKSRLVFWTLKFGMLLLGIGIGLIAAILFARTSHNWDEKQIAYVAFILTFGGIGLIISFIIERKMLK